MTRRISPFHILHGCKYEPSLFEGDLVDFTMYRQVRSRTKLTHSCPFPPFPSNLFIHIQQLIHSLAFRPVTQNQLKDCSFSFKMPPHTHKNIYFRSEKEKHRKMERKSFAKLLLTTKKNVSRKLSKASQIKSISVINHIGFPIRLI